jgi:hypothetical protein
VVVGLREEHKLEDTGNKTRKIRGIEKDEVTEQLKYFIMRSSC